MQGIYALQHPVDTVIILAFFLLIAFPVHEFFHAFMAYRLGDGTAKMFGKLTLNPIAHFHPIGGWMLILSTALFGLPFGFAATPVNPSNLRGRYAEAYVAAAGPLSNFLLAAVFAIPLRIVLSTDLGLEFPWLAQSLYLIVYLDILLGFFNLIPVSPLDGGTILLNIVPPRIAWQLRPLFAQYGIFVLIAIIVFGAPFLQRLTNAVYGILVG
jgi:Zn-dependent protease